MSKRKIQNIVLLGAGNVAWHLGQALVANGLNLLHVHSRTRAAAQTLGEQLGCPFGNHLQQIPDTADLYILAVSDGQIAPLAKVLADHLSPTSLLVHTSGATPMAVLGSHFSRTGVFYPLQTFSKSRTLDFERVPLCLLAAYEDDYQALEKLALRISDTVEPVSDEQRLQLHLAAVFVNNFTNHLQFISQVLVEKEQLPGQLLLPLLRETIAKLDDLSPEDAQTGPAIRGDLNTMQRHLQLLTAFPAWQELYRQLSASIRESNR